MIIEAIISNYNDSIQHLVDQFDLKYGFMDTNYCLTNEEVGLFYVLYDPYRLGRGIEVYIEDNELHLAYYLPATPFEMDLFYDLVRYVCDKVKVPYFKRNQEIVRIENVYDFIDIDKQQSIALLNTLKQKLQEDEYVYLFGVRNQICIGQKEYAIFKNDLDVFEQYLHDIQNQKYIYATPICLNVEENHVIASYPIKDETRYVIPITPEIMYDPGCELKGFYFSPFYTFIPFDDFISHIQDYTYYDSNHILVTFNKHFLFDLIQKYDTGFFEESESYGTYGRIIDSGFLHCEKIQDFNFNLDEINGFNHITIYLKWCYENNLLDEQFISETNLKEAMNDDTIDLRAYLRDHPTIQGDLQEGFFNELGKQFTSHYYVFLKDGYPNDVDTIALQILGKEAYYCHEYMDEAYLFVNYDDYLEPLYKCINEAFKNFLKSLHN